MIERDEERNETNLPKINIWYVIFVSKNWSIFAHFFHPLKRELSSPRKHIENGRNVNKVNLNQIAFIKIKVKLDLNQQKLIEHWKYEGASENNQNQKLKEQSYTSLTTRGPLL